MGVFLWNSKLSTLLWTTIPKYLGHPKVICSIAMNVTLEVVARIPRTLHSVAENAAECRDRDLKL